MPTLQFLGLGAVTPLGLDVWSSAAAARAGVCGFAEHPALIDSVGEPLRVAAVPWLGIDLQGAQRWLALLLPAIDQALEPLAHQTRNRAAAAGPRLQLCLALPAERPGHPPGLARALRQSIEQLRGAPFASISTFEAGHAAGLMALASVARACNCGAVDGCVVAGVDSYLAPETLMAIEGSDQLHGAGPLNNAWGFIPGEAAGSVLLGADLLADLLSRAGQEPFGELVGVGLGREPHPMHTDGVCVGEGLTQAFRAALATLAPGEVVENVYCDLNGEPFRADEYGFTALRNKERFRSASDFVAPADCWGDIGAAGAPLHIALALIAHRKGYGKGELSMVWGSSESGERGAAVLRAPAASRHWRC